MNSRPLLLLMAVASLGALGAALTSQYAFNMQPCPWCVLQRLIFVVIALACLIGLFVNRVLGAVLVLPLALGGGAAALYQHFVAAKSQSCNLTLADRIVSGLSLDTLLPQVFEVRASCADAAVNLVGVPYDFWSLALYAVLALMALAVLRSHR